MTGGNAPPPGGGGKTVGVGVGNGAVSPIGLTGGTSRVGEAGARPVSKGAGA